MGTSIVPTLRVLRPWIGMAAAIVVGLFVGYWANAAIYPVYAPEQPIDFSHRIHAGENGIDCQYCHVDARRSASAGVPSVAKCMGCHGEIATDQPQIRLLTDYWENQEPIPWVKVHDLPDFVHFPHKRHVAAGLACQDCHGAVEEMDVVVAKAPLKMGLCLDCHREKEVQRGTDCQTCHK